ncbi:hypothetical protein B0T10DRAFT_584034 [Thelonectria olida]|uniref:Uncharacterized protein n=1 Tax=Thelonectria olida TaxID=1576542 RepID=A0A9P8WI51_9HYPO|nr:hypothetical protein B0T10DRAFT_584034 [Thelonectria olida]
MQCITRGAGLPDCGLKMEHHEHPVCSPLLLGRQRLTMNGCREDRMEHQTEHSPHTGIPHLRCLAYGAMHLASPFDSPRRRQGHASLQYGKHDIAPASRPRFFVQSAMPVTRPSLDKRGLSANNRPTPLKWEGLDIQAREKRVGFTFSTPRSGGELTNVLQRHATLAFEGLRSSESFSSRTRERPKGSKQMSRYPIKVVQVCSPKGPKSQATPPMRLRICKNILTLIPSHVPCSIAPSLPVCVGMFHQKPSTSDGGC